MKQAPQRQAFSLLELLAVTVLLGIVATVIMVRVSEPSEAGKIAACDVYQGDKAILRSRLNFGVITQELCLRAIWRGLEPIWTIFPGDYLRVPWMAVLTQLTLLRGW